MAGTLTITTKELRDQFGSRRFLILFGLVLTLSSLAAYQGVDYIRNNTDAGFVYIFSGTRLSYSFIQIMVFFGPLLGLSLGFDAINKERTNGTLSILLGQPIYRDNVINAKFISGAIAIISIVAGTITIMCGITIPMLGYGPSLDEVTRIIALTGLTIIYLLLWLALGTLYSVIAKRTSTSILASIATWMLFSIVVSIMASFIAGVIVPVSTESIRGGVGQGLKVSEEVLAAMQDQNALRTSIEMISPTTLYETTASSILGVITPGIGLGAQGFERTISLAEALAGNWASIAALTVGLVICFVASYMMFLRTEIRPGV
jgi:ABC-2 type transport system permease protein